MTDDYRINARFNLRNEAEQSAADYLQAIHRQNRKSRNRFIVDSVIEKIANDNSNKVLLESIRQIFREEVQSLEVVATPIAAITTFKAELTEERKVENAKSVLGDLDMFDWSHNRSIMAPIIFCPLKAVPLWLKAHLPIRSCPLRINGCFMPKNGRKHNMMKRKRTDEAYRGR